jgi:pimeloyl-ACP methyl ester carboxylesterase
MKSGYVDANGVNYYYEIHGEGQPVLLLHGGLATIEGFGPSLPALSVERQVIAVDLHGHGRTALGDRAINLHDMADDMAVLLTKLGHSKVDAMGYSLGGGVAFRLALQHPERVRRLVLVSCGFSTDGFHAEMRPMQAAVGAAMAESMKATPIFEAYAAVAPDPEEFPRLLDSIGDYMREDYDWSEDVKKVTIPTMLVFGDSDMFTTPHMAEFYNLLGGNLKDAGWQRENMSEHRLAIIPDHTHYDMFVGTDVVRAALPFLNGDGN